MFGIGFPELVLILIVALVVFGPNQLPEVARSIGKGIREVKKMTSDVTDLTDLSKTTSSSHIPPNPANPNRPAVPPVIKYEEEIPASTVPNKSIMESSVEDVHKTNAQMEVTSKDEPPSTK